MKRALIIAGGLLFAFAWQAQAQTQTQPQDSAPEATAQTPTTPDDSVGGQPTMSSMSGGPAAAQGLTRAQVYQQLIQSQKDGEAARMQELFKGGN